MSESRLLRLSNRYLQASVLPLVGGALTRFDWIGAQEIIPLMRPLAIDGDLPDPNLLACYPMVPWCNRIGGGTFSYEGVRHTLAPNRPLEPYPIHGGGWLATWRVHAQCQNAVTLRLENHHTAPFQYESELGYALNETTLAIRLAVKNIGQSKLPFGLGIHPWFERTRGTIVHALSAGYWQSGPDLLPTHLASLPTPSPENLLLLHAGETIDNAFCDWDGVARIIWPERSLSMSIETLPRLRHFVFYAPAGKSFFCFEPVTHPVNALNLPEPYAHEGLVDLSPGASMAIEVRFTATPL